MLLLVKQPILNFRKANGADADMIIAVTRNDEINMLICQIAYTTLKYQKNCKDKITKLPRAKFSKLYNKDNLPIDVIISPEFEIVKSLLRKLEALVS